MKAILHFSNTIERKTAKSTGPNSGARFGVLVTVMRFTFVNKCMTDF